MKSKNRIKKTIIAGNLIWESISPCFSRWDSESQRRAKNYLHKGGKSSVNDQYKNHRKSKDRTAQLIAANVKPNRWIFCTLTFDNDNLPKTRKDAYQKIRSFFRMCRQFELENRKQLRTNKLQYFWTLETGENRYHIHLLVNIPYWFKDQFVSLWKYGQVTNAKRIIDEFGKGSNAYAITEYITKEQYKYGMPAGNVAVKHSKGLQQPIIYSEYVTSDEHLTLPYNGQYAPGGEYYTASKVADGFIYQYEKQCYVINKEYMKH